MSVLPIMLLAGVLMIASVQSEARYRYKWYNRTKYLLSMDHERFDLAKMNGRCKKLGGYLLQIDNKGESDFVQGMAYNAKGRGPFFTGITDKQREGRYLNYNDNTPAKYLKWRWFQPDNWWGEDCVEMSYTGLNDIGCEKSGRYFCEVPP
ncbi:collectin-12 [Plakobranchus ocellatus]|uniref:Collectin-12 n=1 Tax=Plakobranchus ocellatus TaxID=259542 RepID=A0AAV4BAJ4_9GAST|nr:collectin-12 [Plakobranchus ocellatus]